MAINPAMSSQWLHITSYRISSIHPAWLPNLDTVIKKKGKRGMEWSFKKYASCRILVKFLRSPISNFLQRRLGVSISFPRQPKSHRRLAKSRIYHSLPLKNRQSTYPGSFTNLTDIEPAVPYFLLKLWPEDDISSLPSRRCKWERRFQFAKIARYQSMGRLYK